MDPTGVEALKKELNMIKELALEGETTVETKSGFGYTVTVDDLLKFVGLDDDIIRRK